MKRLLPISLIVSAALIVIAALVILGPIVGNVFSTVNNSLPSLGGGSAPAPELRGLYESSVAPQAMLLLADQPAPNNVPGAPAAQVERIVIKNADLAIVVSDVIGRMKNIQVMAEQMGGFVVSSNLYKTYTTNNVQIPEAQIVIRVPAEKLDEALDEIKKDAVDVRNETTSGQDVTSEYVDLQSRLKNLEAAEAQLDEILKNATDTTDVVSIFNQLVSYREQIELIKGQIKYYDEAASLSAISVRIIAEETIQPLVIGKWEPKGAALEAVQDLIDFLKGFTEFAIRFVIYILPSWLIVGFSLYLIFIVGRALFRKFNKSSPGQDKSSSKYVEINSAEIGEITDIGELEQKIREGETLLIEAKGSSMGVWAPLIVSIGIVIYLTIKLATSGIYLILIGFGLVYLGFNIWRVYSANKQKKETESKLEEFRDRKAELQGVSAEKK